MYIHVHFSGLAYGKYVYMYMYMYREGIHLSVREGLRSVSTTSMEYYMYMMLTFDSLSFSSSSLFSICSFSIRSEASLAELTTSSS